MRTYQRKKSQEPSPFQGKIWEVARATSAAPTFFGPIVIDGCSYSNGGTIANNPSILPHGSQRISKGQENMLTHAHGREITSLRPMHSSRVSKASRKASGSVQSTKLPQKTNRCRNTLERKLGTSAASSAGLKPLQQSASVNIQLRRSGRISKKPDWWEELPQTLIMAIRKNSVGSLGGEPAG
jgi:hypothetical protein